MKSTIIGILICLLIIGAITMFVKVKKAEIQDCRDHGGYWTTVGGSFKNGTVKGCVFP